MAVGISPPVRPKCVHHVHVRNKIFLSSFILSICFLIVFFLYSLMTLSSSHRAGGLVFLHSVSFHHHREGVIFLTSTPSSLN